MQHRFLLIGINGVYNYGCEAIVRGTVVLLKQQFPDCKIFYATPRPRLDKLALKDLKDLEVISLYGSYLHLDGSFLSWLLRSLGITRKRKHKFDPHPKLLEMFDTTISIGGDMYTIGSHDTPGEYKNLLVEWGEQALANSKKYVLWGASVGPFPKNSAVEKYYSNHLRRISLITAREDITLGYLRDLGISENVKQVADPAFWMPSANISDVAQYQFPEGSKPIGLNLSPLSMKHVFLNKDESEHIAIAVEYVRSLLVRFENNILLIPHVINPNKVDNDYLFLKQVYNRLGEFENRLALLPPDLGAMKTKAIIGQCHVLIAARMHCAIAGVSMGVPTLFIQYSPKAKGMAEYIYGNDRWCLPLSELDAEKLRSKTGEIFSERDTIMNTLQSRQLIWKEDAQKNVRALYGLL